ncbi:MAG: cytochrome d ubiquinol oxidase subunit II [Nocardiopsaceae bacterium]|nr:cytochrome d ubiquinol oxidase subunit II [Nocardiopsaceae bacterium]
MTSWLNPASVLIGLLSVAFSGYLAAVFLAADARRPGNDDSRRTLTSAFRRRAMASGVASGALALAGLFVMRSEGLSLLHGLALAFVIISGLAGLATLALCFAWRFALARVTAALAVATVVIGWAAAQAPRLLPGLTVPEAAAGQSTLVALVVAVGAGLVVLVPSLALLFGLFLRGKLDTPEHHHAEEPVSPAPATPGKTPAPDKALAPEKALAPDEAPAPDQTGAARGTARVRGWATLAVAGLLGGTGLLVLTDAGWEHILGTALLVLCAVSVFALAAPASGSGPDPD